MSRPPVFPLKPPARPGVFRRTPPAIFVPILGLLGLGVVWRKAVSVYSLPTGLVEMVLGAVSLLWLFALLAYLVKVVRRPGVISEDLRILPGRAGLAALAMSVELMAAVLAPYAPSLARAVLLAGLAVHLGMMVLLVRVILASPPEGRAVTPVWHLAFVGIIVSGIAALDLGEAGLARALLYATMPVAGAIWGISLVQLIRRIPPAPLRPLLAIHLAPASLFASVSAGLGENGLASGFVLLGGLILLAILVSLRWIIEAGFSPLWGAFTFPLAAYAGALLRNGPGWEDAGAVFLIAATLVIPPIALKIMQAWAKGELAARTNAAAA